jgi:hypothetical protein
MGIMRSADGALTEGDRVSFLAAGRRVVAAGVKLAQGWRGIINPTVTSSSTSAT